MEKGLKEKHYGHIMLDGAIYTLTSSNPIKEHPCKLCDLKDKCSDIGLLIQLCDLFDADTNEYFKLSGMMIDEYTIRPL